MTWIHVGYAPTQTHPDSPPTAESPGRQSNSRRQRPCPPSRNRGAQAASLAPQCSMCSTESQEGADLPLGRSALASRACTHLILGPHGSFDGPTRNEQPSACGYSCPHDPIARGTSTSRQTSPVDASPGTRGAADRPQGSDGVAPMAETLPADTAPRRATHAALHPIGMQYTLSVQVYCSRSGALLPIRCCACTQAQTGSGGAVRERPRECSRAGIGRRPRQIRPEPDRPNREAPPPPSERPRGQSPIPSTGLRDPATIRVTV